MEEPRSSAARRRAVVWLVVLAAAALVAGQIVAGPPGSGYGWGSVVISCVLVLVPLAVVGLMVQSGEGRYRTPAILVSAALTALVLVALVGNWNGQDPSARTLDSLAALLVLASFAGVLLVELPPHRRR